MASAPHFPPNPCRLLNGGDTIGHDICGAMTEIFHNLRYLTACLTDWGRSVDNHDLASFIKQRSTLEHRLFSLTIRKADMKHCDYHFEGRRLGALIYLQCVLRNFKPFCAALRNLKAQLVEVILEAEEQCGTIGDPRLYRGSLAWVWFMGGILALNRDEENFFPTRIVNSTKVWMLEGSKTWADMEVMLREIAWDDNLLTAECSSLWSRVGEIWGKNVGGIEVSSRSVHRCLSGGSGL